MIISYFFLGFSYALSIAVLCYETENFLTNSYKSSSVIVYQPPTISFEEVLNGNRKNSEGETDAKGGDNESGLPTGHDERERDKERERTTESVSSDSEGEN